VTLIAGPTLHVTRRPNRSGGRWNGYRGSRSPLARSRFSHDTAVGAIPQTLTSHNGSNPSRCIGFIPETRVKHAKPFVRFDRVLALCPSPQSMIRGGFGPNPIQVA
jgi:hypothetical protein